MSSFVRFIIDILYIVALLQPWRKEKKTIEPTIANPIAIPIVKNTILL